MKVLLAEQLGKRAEYKARLHSAQKVHYSDYRNLTYRMSVVDDPFVQYIQQLR